MALKLRAKARPPQDSLHRRCALFDVRARTGPALPQHVHCADRVGVLVMSAGYAVKHRLLRAVALVATTAGRTQAGGIGRVDLFEDSSRLFQLPGNRLGQAEKPRPQNGSVETGFLPDIRPGIFDRTLCAFRHVLRLQVFRIHAAVLLRERMCGFPVEILTNAAHSAMQPLNPLLETSSLASRLVFVEGLGKPLLGELLSSGKIERELSLQHGDALFELLEPVGVEIKEASVAQSHGVNHADVDADLRRLHLRRLDLELGREDDKPVPAVFVDVDLPNSALCQGTVRIPKGNGARLAIANPADLRKLDSAVGVVNIRSLELRDTKAITRVPGLELRPLLAGGIVLWTKAVLDCSVEIAQRLLKGLGHRLLEKRGLFRLLPHDQFCGQLVVGEELLSGLPAFVLQRQRLVEHEAPTPRVPAQSRTQGLVDVEFKLEAAKDFHGSVF